MTNIFNRSASAIRVELKNLTLPALDKEKLMFDLGRIQDRSPSDASGFLSLSKENDGITGRMVIRSLARRFEVESLGKTFDEVMEGLVMTVHRQIELWREERDEDSGYQPA